MFHSYVILFNIAKQRNFGNLIRTAHAFGVTEIVIVGRSQFMTYGSFTTDDTRRRTHFYTLAEAVDYLHAKACQIVGVEITESADPIDARPFAGNTAFLLGNEGTGISPQQQAYCDRMVYIRQYGMGASINVNAAAAIVLHHFALWATFPESPRDGQKFYRP